ncbi:CDP-glycerol glycerophosphotransferase family protein [Modestobacter sp. DSM 44400]|uniref:CDP-glycerol glycerophosphotransferase family protein n=1 Tax=Modestobacter sp. DSM 44400 TaxID=1550230 RepID=UPI001587F7F6|nr:CDP-glycerol glycerophosphotransferase family protein [Modestobacter sp. DSM 44400]
MNRRQATGRLKPLRAAVRRLLTATVTTLDYLVPKNSRVLVIGGDEGTRFGGNSRELFEYASRTEGWDPYWFSTSRALVAAVEAAHPGRAVNAMGPRALWLGVRARAVFVSHSRRDVGLLGYSRLRRYIQLTHGVGPKTMGYAKREFDRPALDRETSTYAHVVCSSDYEATFWERGYHVPLADIWPTGVPRNDLLLEPADPALAVKHPVLRGRTVLYAPTFRDWAVLEDYLPIPGMDATALVDLLGRHDATLLIRPHYYEAGAARATIDRVGSPRVQPADDTIFGDTNELLKHVDVLITDYSSIYMDYLLLDRPVIFNPVDLAEYEGQRGFFFRYADHTPGPKAVTEAEFLAALDTELSGRDPHRQDRARTRELFFKYPSGGARERIMRRLAEQPVRWPGPLPRRRPAR